MYAFGRMAFLGLAVLAATMIASRELGDEAATLEKSGHPAPSRLTQSGAQLT
jgi:hypothetical protein